MAAGAAAVVLTADTPVLGTRYPLPEGRHVWDMADPAWLGANSARLRRPHPEDRAKAMDLGPDDLGWLASSTGLPVVVKGVLRADDARRCAEAGAAACGSPTTAAASSTRRSPPPAASPRYATPCGARSRCTSTGECARGCT